MAIILIASQLVMHVYEFCLKIRKFSSWAVHESIMTMPTHFGYRLERLQDRPKGTRCSEELLLFLYNKKTNSLWLYNQGLTKTREEF